MAYDIGTARGVIELEYNGRGAQQASDDLDKVGGTGEKTNASLKKVSNVAGVAGLAIAGGLAAGVNAAANFEQRLSAIEAVSGATGKQMDAMRDKALQLGKDTKFSASESAMAMEELVKAGLSVDDVLNGAADATVALAAAGEIDLPQAATISANAMNQFNLSAKDMVGVTDDIAGAANASAIDVSEFGQSLQQVGAVANLAGVSFHDTATAIALMGNAGIKGSDAGTSLKSMFQRLQPTTQAQISEMERLGILYFNNQKAMQTLRDNGVKPAGKDFGTLNGQLNQLAAKLSGSEVGSAKAARAQQKLMLQTGATSNAFYDQHGRLKDLSAVSGILQDSLKGMTAQQKQATLQTLFGSDAIRAAAILANNGAKGFDKMSQSMGKVSAADVAAKRMDNFKGSLEQLKGSLETAGIAAGTVLLPFLRSLVDTVNSLLGAFLSLSPGTQKFIVFALAAVAAVLLIVAGVGRMIIFASELTKALLVLRIALAQTWVAALGPIALIIAAVVAIIAIIVILYKKNETFRNAVNAAWNAIKTVITAVWQWIVGTLVPGLVAAWQAIVSGLENAKAAIAAVWNGIVSVVTTVFNFIAAVIRTYINIWKTIITTGINIIRAVISAVFGFIAGVIRTYIAIWTTIISAGINAIKAIWGAIWGTFGGIITAVFNLIVAIVRLGIAIIGLVIRTMLAGAKAIWTAVWGAIASFTSAVWARIVAAVRFYIMLIKAVITVVWNAIRAVTMAVWNAVAGFIRAVWARIVGIIRPYVQAAKAVVQSAWNAIRSATSAIWNAVVGVIRSVLGRITGAVRSGVNTVKSAVSAAWNAVKSATSAAWNALVGIIRSAVERAVGVARGIKDRIVGFFSGAASWLYNAGVNIIQGLINGIEHMIGNVTAKLNSLTAKIKAAKGPPEKDKVLLIDNGELIIKSLMVGFDNMIPAALDQLRGFTVDIASPTGPLAVPVAALPAATGGGAGGATAGLRVVSGELRLDDSGRAFITGLATEADKADGEYADLLARMG